MTFFFFKKKAWLFKRINTSTTALFPALFVFAVFCSLFTVAVGTLKLSLIDLPCVLYVPKQMKLWETTFWFYYFVFRVFFGFFFLIFKSITCYGKILWMPQVISHRQTNIFFIVWSLTYFVVIYACEKQHNF